MTGEVDLLIDQAAVESKLLGRPGAPMLLKIMKFYTDVGSYDWVDGEMESGLDAVALGLLGDLVEEINNARAALELRIGGDG